MRPGGVPVHVIEARWMARLRRQQILGTVDYTAFIGEAALRTAFGGPRALAEQLRHLVDAPNRGIGVRVVAEHLPYSLITNSWLLLEFPDTSPVVNIEAWNGSLYLHDEVAEAYLGLVRRLEKIALSAPASLAMLRNVLEEVSHVA